MRFQQKVKVVRIHAAGAFTAHTPGLQLEGPLLPRDLEAVWVVFIGGLLHLHAIHSDSAAHSKTLPN